MEPNEGPKRPLREDLFAATVASLTWLIGLGYMIGDLAPREFRPLLVGWVLLTTITIVVGMIVKNVRMFVVFSGIGLLCCVIYAAVKLS